MSLSQPKLSRKAPVEGQPTAVATMFTVSSEHTLLTVSVIAAIVSANLAR